MFKKSNLFILIGLSVFLLTAPIARAITPLSVRLSQPKSPTQDKDMNPGFVALDATNRSVTVTCYVQKPGEGSFIQFDSTKNLIPGGDNGICFSGSVIQDKGTYIFKVIATAGADVVESNVVSVDYDSDDPGTPTNYNHDHSSACEHKISFKTAADGHTTKVEIYRSTDQQFDTNGSTRITTVSVGSDISKEYIDTVPDCGTTYYYAIRAFDDFGNASGIVGDTTSQESTQTTASPVPAIPINPATSQVKPPQTEPTPSTVSENTQTQENTGQVLGEKDREPQPENTPLPTKTSSTQSLLRYWPFALALVLLIVVLWYRRKRY